LSLLLTRGIIAMLGGNYKELGMSNFQCQMTNDRIFFFARHPEPERDLAASLQIINPLLIGLVVIY